MRLGLIRFVEPSPETYSWIHQGGLSDSAYPTERLQYSVASLATQRAISKLLITALLGTVSCSVTVNIRQS
jgi:hypothetical protein